MRYLVFLLLISTTSCFGLQYEFEGWTTVFDCEDIDNDNDIDIVIGTQAGGVIFPATTIMRNDGECNFSFEYIYHPCGFGRSNNRNFLQDVDNNNFVDIVSISAIDTQVVLRVDYNNNGQFNNYANCIADSSFMPMGHVFSFGDWNRDGYVEAFFLNSINDSLFWSYFMNDGTGNFLPYEENYPYHGRVELADMDQDGFDEIILCGYNGLRIYSYPDEIDPVAIIEWENIYGFFNIADFDNDGDNDICRSSFDDDADILYFSIFENLGNFTFAEHESTLEGGNLVYMTDWDRILAKDINGDNLVDLSYFQGVFYNNGNYEFNEVELLPINCGPIGLFGFFDFVDINGDTTLDFLTSYTNIAMDGFFEIWFQDSNGNFLEEPPVGITNDELVNTNYKLNNYPNPFNPTTTIEFSIQTDSKVELSIFNIKGQKIKNLTQNEFGSGIHSIIWNGDDELETPVSSGIYYYKLNINGKTEAVKKCILLK